MFNPRYAILAIALALTPAYQPDASAQKPPQPGKYYSSSIASLQSHAEAGDADAQYELGERYYAGKGVAQDFALAWKWTLKAAQQGQADAQNAAGLMLKEGQGTTKNEKEAFSWVRKSAEQGNAPGQDELAMMYEKGIGVKQDQAEALRWYTRAADQELPIALFDLGYMYDNGIGTKADTQKAIELYAKAAIYVPMARHNLAAIYSEKDLVSAYKWQLLAVSAEGVRIVTNPPATPDNRFHESIKDAMTLGRMLKDDEKQKARQLAEEWINSNAENLGPEPKMYQDSTKALWDSL